MDLSEKKNSPAEGLQAWLGNNHCPSGGGGEGGEEAVIHSLVSTEQAAQTFSRAPMVRRRDSLSEIAFFHLLLLPHHPSKEDSSSSRSLGSCGTLLKFFKAGSFRVSPAKFFLLVGAATSRGEEEEGLGRKGRGGDIPDRKWLRW